MLFVVISMKFLFDLLKLRFPKEIPFKLHTTRVSLLPYNFFAFFTVPLTSLDGLLYIFTNNLNLFCI